MTPPTALTSAARKAAKRAAARPVEGAHPRRLRRTSAPTGPRRVSGPVARSATPRASERPAAQIAGPRPTDEITPQ